MNVLFRQKNKRTFEFGRFSYESYVLVSGLFLLLWLLAVSYWLLVLSCFPRAFLVLVRGQILKRVQDDIVHGVMLNLFQHLTASLSCSSPRTDPELNSG